MPPPTKEDVEEELDGLDPETRFKVEFVAEYMAMMDVNCSPNNFAGMPFGAQCDYLHDARNAVMACKEWEEKRGQA